jgi:hypothetical protein
MSPGPWPAAGCGDSKNSPGFYHKAAAKKMLNDKKMVHFGPADESNRGLAGWEASSG